MHVITLHDKSCASVLIEDDFFFKTNNHIIGFFLTIITESCSIATPQSGSAPVGVFCSLDLHPAHWR